jgi:hypothetical protein
MLEIDVPGHASSWQYGEPDLMADCIQKYTNVNGRFGFLVHSTRCITIDRLAQTMLWTLLKTEPTKFSLISCLISSRLQTFLTSIWEATRWISPLINWLANWFDKLYLVLWMSRLSTGAGPMMQTSLLG